MTDRPSPQNGADEQPGDQPVTPTEQAQPEQTWASQPAAAPHYPHFHGGPVAGGWPPHQDYQPTERHYQPTERQLGAEYQPGAYYPFGGGYSQPDAGYPQPGAEYQQYYSPYGFWSPPPVARRKRPHAMVYGAVAAAVAAAVTVGGVALAVDHANNPSSQTSLNTPTQNGPFSGNGDPNGSGQNGFGFGQNGSGQSGTDTTGTATAAQSVGIVDINTTLDYGQGKAAGTGIVLSSDGEVLTNNHVVDGSTAISVTVVSSGKTYTARVVGTDPTDDVAVIQLQNASGLATAKLGNSADVRVGTSVTAVGNAGGTGGTPSSATGTVTALNQSITASDGDGSNAERLTGMIQVNADIQAGDSGGALYENAGGTIIGMNTAASSSGSRFQTGGATTGFAIPISDATKIADQIESGTDNATIHQGYPAFIGVQLSSISQASGAAISGVIPGSGAANAGLAAGDVITSVDGNRVSDGSALSNVMRQHNPGDRITVDFTDASGASHSVTVTLGQGPAD
ncbi:MAG: trypsin-like peptidase domain-containing protein [Jatrophihabitantaceae bacterium]